MKMKKTCKINSKKCLSPNNKKNRAINKMSIKM